VLGVSEDVMKLPGIGRAEQCPRCGLMGECVVGSYVQCSSCDDTEITQPSIDLGELIDASWDTPGSSAHSVYTGWIQLPYRIKP
jgi:hypothetical protein